jgi:hypothetical protein
MPKLCYFGRAPRVLPLLPGGRLKLGKELQAWDSVWVLTSGADPLASWKSGPAFFRGAFALIRCDGSARLVRGQSVAFVAGL